MIEIKADLHTHTVHSGHAYSTFDELAREASRNGLDLIAITDHGPAMPDGPHEYYFGNLCILPDELYGVKILKGVEANILKSGKLDLAPERLNNLDFVIAGIHDNTGHNLKNEIEYTEAVVKAVESGYVDMLSHPVNSNYPLDLEAVVQACKANNVILEINASSYNPAKNFSRADRIATVRLISLARDNNVPLAANSDAHFCKQVGNVSYLKGIFRETFLQPEDLINTSAEKVLLYLYNRIKNQITMPSFNDSNQVLIKV
ncbi:MAG: phosphatase [Bacillota bacterium]